MSSPSPHLSSSLIQLLVLRSVDTASDRFKVLGEVVDMVASASGVASRLEGGGADSDEEEGDGGDSRRPQSQSMRGKHSRPGAEQTFTLVSAHTAAPATITIVGILDKVNLLRRCRCMR